jgi:uncharacterized protein
MAAPGVGLTLQPQLLEFIDANRRVVDYVELVPDTSWTDLGPGWSPRYVDHHDIDAWLERVGLPVVLHSIGMSIASVHHFDREHVDQIARWQRRLGARWHSDHLAWHRAPTPLGEVNVNITLPATLDREMLDLVVGRVRVVQSVVQAPFLLENNVYYFDCGENEVDEASFLAEVIARTGCGLLLDLHNLWVNVINRGWDPMRYLEVIPLDRVIEIHIAGGMEMDGYWLDAHSGVAPDEVWRLLANVAPLCRDLRGVTFELFGSWYETVGDEGLMDQLDRARSVLSALGTVQGPK